MAEFTDLDTICIPKESRYELREDGVIPDGWIISIGAYEGVACSPSRYIHNGFKLVVCDRRDPENSSKAGPRNVASRPRDYLQVSTFVLGKLAIQAMSATYLAHSEIYEEGFIPPGMRRIWPTTGPFTWSATAPLADADILVAADAFSGWLIGTATL